MALKNIHLTKQYLFELVERASRFYIHLEDIKKQFYTLDSKVDDKLIFIESYKDCIAKIVEGAVSLQKIILHEDEKTTKDVVITIKDLLTVIKDLHLEYLSHLPRPSEPIELRRFSRIIDKHVFNLNESGVLKDRKQISIYVSEAIGESVYSKDPLSKFKETIFNNKLESINKLFNNSIATQFIKQDIPSNTIHITIPRIDAHNPCRWPTLIHELGHSIFNDDLFKNKDIVEDFKKSLISEQLLFVEKFELDKKIILRSWLRECWCDLFACVVFGPAFWFAQYASFVFDTGVNDDENYPKPLFRLKLIHNILLHRFSKTLFMELKQTMEVSEEIIDILDQEEKNGFNNDEDLREVYMYFKEYFRRYFFKHEDSALQFETEILNNKLMPLIKYTEEIEETTIRDLVEYLKLGLPIPSKQIKSNNIAQKPTYVQEIILAAWHLRNNWLKDNVWDELKLLGTISEELPVTDFEGGIIKLIKRFDESILRSIQVSEWFDLFFTDHSIQENFDLEEEFLNIKSELFLPAAQLVDIEIFNLLKTRELKIIPIMNLKEQLGATSIDLRLGTSFQLYYQTKYGTIDFTNEQSLKEAEANSNLIDLDFLESITISPGQFLLGHTMEYIKLPESIAAEIEGRSSFARLGLEIHMTAGFVDPGFEGVITLELYNAGPNPIKLFPGIRIAQLKLLPINMPLRPYNKRNDAKYKGLLSHHTSKQFKDYEIATIIKKTRKDVN